MAEKYTIQIQPQVSSSDAKKMENDLNKRFSDVLKKFGKGLNDALRFSTKAGLSPLKGGIIGAAAAIGGALITNPFEKINEDLNRTLERYDDIATRAAEFGVSSGKYFQAVQIAGSAGVKDLDTILARFNERLNAARSGEDKTLINFTNEKDLVDAFFNFADSLRKLDVTERNKAVEDVFGSKYGLRIAELLQTDISERRKQFSRYSEDQLSRAINKVAGIEEVQAIGRQKQAADELFLKSNAISTGSVRTQDQVERAKTELEATQLSQYQTFAELKLIQERAAVTLENIRSDITGRLTTVLERIGNVLNKIFDSIERMSQYIKKLKFWK